MYAITAVQDVCPQHRMKLTAAWQINKKWQHAEPGQCRPVIHVPIVEAMCGVALAWGWPRFTALLLIGFLCMLHPSEYLCLTRGDIIFPSDAMSDRDVAYTHVRNPKTARFARRQHCRLEDPSVLRFLEARSSNALLSMPSCIQVRKTPFAVSGMLFSSAWEFLCSRCDSGSLERLWSYILVP